MPKKKGCDYGQRSIVVDLGRDESAESARRGKEREREARAKGAPRISQHVGSFRHGREWAGSTNPVGGTAVDPANPVLAIRDGCHKQHE